MNNSLSREQLSTVAAAQQHFYPEKLLSSIKKIIQKRIWEHKLSVG
jgi:hypothetical protein